MRTIAQRAGVDPAPVLLTAYAIALSHTGGVNPVVLRPVVSNRFRPGLSNVVAPISQSGICLLDVAEVPFAEAVARTAKASMVAYKHAYFEPARAQPDTHYVSLAQAEALLWEMEAVMLSAV